MTKTPHYENGQWSEGDDRLERAIDDACPDVIDLEALHLSRLISTGYGDYGFGVDLWGASASWLGPRHDLPPYVLDVETQDFSRFFTAGTLQDALDLVARWAPIVTASLLSEVRRDLGSPGTSGFGIVQEILTAAQTGAGAVDRRATEILDDEAARLRRRAARRAAESQTPGGIQ